MIFQAVEDNVINYRSYAYLNVFVGISDQFAPQLSLVRGGTSGFISEDADVGDLVRSGTNTIIEFSITDNDYVSVNI